MSGGLTDPAREGLETLSNGYDERAGEGRDIDPLSAEVLCLETTVRARLQEVARQHAVLVGADALAGGLCGGREVFDGGVFDDFEFVLLVRVEEAVEGGGREEEGFGD